MDLYPKIRSNTNQTQISSNLYSLHITEIETELVEEEKDNSSLKSSDYDTNQNLVLISENIESTDDAFFISDKKYNDSQIKKKFDFIKNI